MSKVIEATGRATGEKIQVYKLNNGNYYDFKNMGCHMPPCSTTGKKEFEKSELIVA